MVRPARTLLLLANDPAWEAAAQRAAMQAGGALVQRAASPKDALDRLVVQGDAFSHLLLEPRAAGSYLRDLLGVTAGEAGSTVAVVLLGEAEAMVPFAAVAYAPTPADLAATLQPPAPLQEAHAPRLSASDLAVAFNADDVECRFQPIVRLADRQVAGMETLARMRHAVYGTIGPDAFIPQIERAGLSLRLTEAVAQCAMAAIAPAVLDASDLFCAINLPLDVLLFPEALARIEALRRAATLPSARLVIELTESRPASDLAALGAAVQRWRDAGYRVAIDDMGPEIANQSALFDLPFNLMKLDKQIVLQSEADGLARSYLQRTVANARARGLAVIAEGIETQAIWRHMQELGVEYGQGFLIARALPASALPVWIEAWRTRRVPAPGR